MFLVWSFSMISVNSLYLDYTILSNPRDLIHLVTGKSMRTMHALENISFQVARGEILGILGPNGCGKSSLLKVLAGIIQPTSGDVHVEGRITAIIEVATGFNPYLTGRENIRRRLMLHGHGPKEIHELEPEIIEFAELEDVIDHNISTYSSGMALRLSFSVVTSVLSEVVLIDELLMVGDEHFQGKCLKRMRQLSLAGRTVVIASHDTGQLERLCDRCIFLERGRVRAQGRPHQVVMTYLKNPTDQDDCYPREYARIESVDVETFRGAMTVSMAINRLKPSSQLHVQIAAHDNKLGILVGLWNTSFDGYCLPPGKGRIRIRAATLLPHGIRGGLLGVAVIRGSGKIPGSTSEDGWGWDNGKQVYFTHGNSAAPPSEGYLGARLDWKRCF